MKAAQTFSSFKRDNGQVRPPDCRPSAASRGYGRRWQRRRIVYLKKHPLCECKECKEIGRIKLATVVDHIIPHKGNQELFWDEDNWQAMAEECHNKKTATSDGGFGKNVK